MTKSSILLAFDCFIKLFHPLFSFLLSTLPSSYILSSVTSVGPVDMVSSLGGLYPLFYAVSYSSIFH